jgi:hypothetical protein
MSDTAIAVVAGAKVYIGGTIDTYTEAEFTEASRAWIQVQNVQNIGSFGDEAEIVTAGVIDGARVRKRKGTADAGTLELVVLRDPLDVGQQALRAGQKTKSVYAIKIVADDAPEGGEPTVHYLAGLVASASTGMDDANSFIQTTFSIALDAAPLTIEASA